jgi:hypothetical protein
VSIQLALHVIDGICEMIGALCIGKHTHNAILLAWFLLRRGKLTHKKYVHLVPLHIVALAVNHGRARFLCFQVTLLVSSIGEV